jgi:hypothetical protein
LEVLMDNPVSKFFSWLGAGLDAGWFSRLLVIAQFYFVYWLLDWSMSFASTALATKADLMGAAANIAAVAAVPQALLMMATSKYMEMRAQQQQTVVIPDRRKEKGDERVDGQAG